MKDIDLNFVIDSSAGTLVTGRNFIILAENCHDLNFDFSYVGEFEVMRDYVEYRFVDRVNDCALSLTDDYQHDLQYITISGKITSGTHALCTGQAAQDTFI